MNSYHLDPAVRAELDAMLTEAAHAVTTTLAPGARHLGAAMPAREYRCIHFRDRCASGFCPPSQEKAGVIIGQMMNKGFEDVFRGGPTHDLVEVHDGEDWREAK